MNCPAQCLLALAGLPPCVLAALGQCPCRCLFRNDRVMAVLVGLVPEDRLNLPLATALTVTYGRVELLQGTNRSFAETGVTVALPGPVVLRTTQAADVLLVLELSGGTPEHSTAVAGELTSPDKGQSPSPSPRPSPSVWTWDMVDGCAGTWWTGAIAGRQRGTSCPGL